MWNAVRLYGCWYAVDVTWDDTEKETPDYSYFLVGNSSPSASGLVFAQSHVPDTQFTQEGSAFLVHPLYEKSYSPVLAPCLWKAMKRA